jgi:predicted oxidoreductase
VAADMAKIKWVVLRTAVSLGINYFDHATCYGDGEAETRFGDAISLTEVKREDLIIQSKCGLRFDKQIFDWRKSNIIESVDGILQRLKMEYIDVLLLHRPDLLYDPEQIAEAERIELAHEEWYRLYLSSGKFLP